MDQGPGLIQQALDKAWLIVVALVGYVVNQNEQKHKATRAAAADAMAEHKAEDEKVHKALDAELQTQRGHIAKLFDQMREDREDASRRHSELMDRMHAGHTTLLTALHSGLASKADKQ